MKWSGRALVATSALGAAWLCWGAIAFAQEDAPAEGGNLDAVVDVRAGGNDAAAASQKRIDDISDETDDLLVGAGHRSNQRRELELEVVGPRHERDRLLRVCVLQGQPHISF